MITNKLTFDPPTRLPELTQNLIRSSQGHSAPSRKISCKSVQPFSRNVADKETERNRPKTIPRPSTGAGKNEPGFCLGGFCWGCIQWHRCPYAWTGPSQHQKQVDASGCGQGRGDGPKACTSGVTEAVQAKPGARTGVRVCFA